MTPNNQQEEKALVVQDQFAGKQISTIVETASGAMAAQAKAAEEASYLMALQRPRNLDQVRSELLRECRRPSFAQVARYRKPIGQGIEGLSIRFVEQAMQIMGNLKSTQSTIYEDNEKRIISVSVTDYERNASHTTQLTIAKTVERRSPRSGQEIVSKRTNSSGQTVYLVKASEDELLNKQAALVSKAIRTNGLRLIPGWLQDEAEQVIIQTNSDNTAKDPDAEKRRLSDAFSDLNIMPQDLAEFLGHDLGKVSPAELVELREVYTTIKDGQTTWQETIDFKRAQRGQKSKPAAKGVKAVKDKLKKTESIDPETGEVKEV